MKILRAADYKRMPWKNGGGETVEIAVFPSEATVENFDWRISMALVTASGPFSIFDGVDRSLSVIQGSGLELSVEGFSKTRIDDGSLPFTFPADARTEAWLTAGPITDLNVMTRRSKFGHQVARLSICDDWEIRSYYVATFILLVGQGELEVAGTSLQRLDAVFLNPGDTATLIPNGPTDVVVAKLAAV